MSLKILFVGLGSIGQRHLRNLSRATDAEFLAVRRQRQVPVLSEDMKVVPGGDLVAQYGLREFDDLEAALAERPDAVFVTNPSALHVPVAAAALRAGCHVFVEKPLSDSMAGVAELRGLSRDQGSSLMVGYQFRFHPGLRFIKQALEDGEIGRVVSAQLVNGEYLPNWHPYEDYRGGYAARRDLGGGALVTQIHDFDVAYWLFGKPRSLFAVGGQLSELELDVEDSVITVMSYDGEQGTIPVSIRQDYLQIPPERSLVIVGERGKIEWSQQAGQVVLHRHGSAQPVVKDYADLDRAQMFIDQTAHFLKVLKGEAEPAVGLDDAIASLEMALAARRSMEEGIVVELGQVTDV